MSDQFHLKVQERAGIVYEGDVASITSYSEVGEFDVLPYHANFISLIKNKLVIRETRGDPREIAFNNALLRVSENKAEVYLGIEGVFSTESAA